MSLRERLKIAAPKLWNWTMEDDVPLTWSKEELTLMRFRCVRTNYLNKNISKELYEEEVKRYRG